MRKTTTRVGPEVATDTWQREYPARAPGRISMGAVAARSTASLVRALNAGTTLNININGWTITGCFQAGGGTIGGVTCVDLSGIRTNSNLATAIEEEINRNQATFGTITASISNTSFAVTAGPGLGAGISMQVTATSGTIYPGGFFCLTSNPCVYNSADNVGQIENPTPWAAGTTTGVGYYSLFAGPPPPTNTAGVYSYGILSIAWQLTGTAATTPMGVVDGGVNVLPNTYLWQCILNCPPVAPSPGSPQEWIVSNAQTVSSETMTLTSGTNGQTGAQGFLIVNWNVRGDTIDWGYFDVQQTGYANADIPVGGLVSTADGNSDANVNTIACATGSAAVILRLSCGSAGYPGVPHSGVFVSSPGNTITNMDNWLDTLYAINSTWGSCQIDKDPSGEAFSANVYIQAWGQANTPVVNCPYSWITVPPSTPALE
jgi:hypothetical protein